jgi:hypothetical protein
MPPGSRASVRREFVPGTTHGIIQKFGNSPNIGGAYEAIWDGGVAYTGWLAAAEKPKIKSSDNTEDKPGGAGALTVRIFGLDENWAEQSEVITLNGTNLVEAQNTYIRVNRILVLTAGANGVNTGTIFAYDNAGAVVLAQITIGFNQTLMALWSVPADKTLYIEEMFFGVAANKVDSVALFVRPFGGVFNVKKVFHVKEASFQYLFVIPFLVEAKSDVVIRALSDTPGSEAAAGFTGWYE